MYIGVYPSIEAFLQLYVYIYLCIHICIYIYLCICITHTIIIYIGVYPSTEGFLQLLDALLCTYGPPDSLGLGYRRPGLMIYLEFVIDDVLLRAHERFYALEVYMRIYMYMFIYTCLCIVIMYICIYICLCDR
jgi:hypothetical protein